MTEEIKPKTSNRGFASMDKEKQKAIARKGGLAASRDRERMAMIGRIGGQKGKRGKSKPQ